MTPRKRRKQGPGRALAALETWPQLDPAPAVGDALRSAEALETLEQAYQAWDALRLERRRFTAAATEARRRLEDDTAFAIGAAKAARSLGARAATGLAAAKSKLKASTSGLSSVTARGNRALAQAQVRLAGLITARLEQRLAHAPPRLQIMVRVLAGDRRILHVVRPSADDAVALARILSGALPTHHGFLTDDAVDQVGAAPHRLYTEADEPRDDSSLRALLKARPAVLPMRGMIPFLLPRPRRSALAARLQLRGPVLELELEDEAGCRGVLTREEAELAAGYFLKLQLDGKLAVSLATGPS